MADLTITASNVKPANPNTVIGRGIAGETVNAGESIYFDSATGKLFRAASTNQTQANNVVGIALNTAALDQPLAYASSGDIVVGTTTPALVAASVYVLGNGAGKISPSADLDSSTNTRYGTVMAISTSTTNLRVGIIASGALNP